MAPKILLEGIYKALNSNKRGEEEGDNDDKDTSSGMGGTCQFLSKRT
jgi:hypothetical protein